MPLTKSQRGRQARSDLNISIAICCYTPRRRAAGLCDFPVQSAATIQVRRKEVFIGDADRKRRYVSEQRQDDLPSQDAYVTTRGSGDLIHGFAVQEIAS